MNPAAWLKSLTTWGKARKILSGKDRGRNVIVLAFFMFTIGTVVEFAGRLVLDEDNIGMFFIVLGAIAFGVGLGAYLNPNGG